MRSMTTPGKTHITGTLMYPNTRTVRARRAISRLASVVASAMLTRAGLESTWEGCCARFQGRPIRESGPVLLNREQVIKTTAKMR